ncbi:MAG: DUF72 domain-containing protein [Planctomycetota bacterium]
MSICVAGSGSGRLWVEMMMAGGSESTGSGGPQMGLFGQGVTASGTSIDPAPTDDDVRTLGERLPAGLRLGTSSWSFPGWAGLVYASEASEAKLAQGGLPAYSAHPLHGTVGLDRSFYRVPTIEQYRGLAGQVPVGFRFLVKAWRAVTDPAEAEGGATVHRSWSQPAVETFLDARFAEDRVVAPAVLGLGDRLGPIVFQFPPLGLARGDVGGFLRKLDGFLGGLPRRDLGPLYAAEFRDSAVFENRWAGELAASLRAHNVALGFAHHPRLPKIDEQRSAMDAGEWPVEAQPACVCRWLLRHGLGYVEAKERFAPFQELREPDGVTRRQVADLARAALGAGRETWVIANNKAEGSAPLTVRELAREVASRSAGGEPG